MALLRHGALKGLSGLRPLSRAFSPAATAASEIAAAGAAAGCKFYQFSFTDLFGVQRSKLVPAARVRGRLPIPYLRIPPLPT